MLLSIIIPQYTEDENMVFPLLSSIDNQLGINFDDIEVIVLNDCSDIILGDAFLQSFVHIKPVYIKLPKNVGLGMCRNAGLARAQGEYVMFCDADDRFYSVNSLQPFLNAIREGKHDFIGSHWLEEIKVNGEHTIFTGHPNDATWVHGKIFRKQYLADKNIKFHRELRVHEDSYFVGLAYELTTNRIFLEQTTYMWCWNDKSMTRINNGDFFYKEYLTFIKSISAMCAVLKKKNPACLRYKVTSFLHHCYFTFQDNRWELEEAAPIRQAARKALRTFYRKYSKYYNEISKEDFAKLYLQKKERFKGLAEKETFTQFIDSLERRRQKQSSKV